MMARVLELDGRKGGANEVPLNCSVKMVKMVNLAGQAGGVGRHTVPPRTTKRWTTTNLKTKNNNCH